MNIYRKTLLKIIDAHLGFKTRRLLAMKLDAKTLHEEVRALNYERKLEGELAELQHLITEHKVGLRLAARVKQREAA